MFISVHRRLKLSDSRLEAARLIERAKRAVLLCKFGATEKRLDKYLREFKNTTLKEACLGLLDDCKVNAQGDHVTITFAAKGANELASLITYGNGPLIGSEILKIAFM